MNKWRVMATKIFGVQLFAVETDGYILKYCDTKEDAEMCIKEMEEEENARLLREWRKADLAKINAEKGTCYHFALNPYDLENMLNCLVDEKISVKKAMELIASWVAKNYSDDCLPN